MGMVASHAARETQKDFRRYFFRKKNRPRSAFTCNASTNKATLNSRPSILEEPYTMPKVATTDNWNPTLKRSAGFLTRMKKTAVKSPLVMSHCLLTRKLQRKAATMMHARSTGGLSPVKNAYKNTTIKTAPTDNVWFTLNNPKGSQMGKTTIATIK